MIKQLSISVDGQGLHAITPQIQVIVAEHGGHEGICTLFLQHTSASLLIQENYDDSARVDLENWLNRLVPENDPLYTHTTEGPDDMPAHLKAAITATQLSIPYQSGSLMLGTWQGIYLWEHRHAPGARHLVVHL
ncbi:MAG: secondary thiamine-phosphate synthase enzyme YjbQ [Pseudomonadota bacterium]